MDLYYQVIKTVEFLATEGEEWKEGSFDCPECEATIENTALVISLVNGYVGSNFCVGLIFSHHIRKVISKIFRSLVDEDIVFESLERVTERFT